VRIVRTRRGFRLVSRGLVLSEVRDRPGPTHTLFDVLAAAVSALSPGPRVALLGFAAGGLVAPLRAMGFEGPIEAVDLDVAALGLFRHVCDRWAGEVRVAQADAVEWLRRPARTWDLVLDDLSVEAEGEIVKPGATWSRLPHLAARRLAPGGVFVANLLPLPGVPWPDLVDRALEPWRRKRVVHLDDYENRIALAGRALPEAAEISRRLRATLRSIGSAQAGRLSVRKV
jgi:hypothetical protein